MDSNSMEDTEVFSHRSDCEQYPGWFLDQLQALRSEGHLMDVTLCAEGKKIPCHRLVLSACSDYFGAMFCGSHADSRKDKIEIGGVRAEALELLVDYAYTAKVTITTNNVQPLFEAANMLQFGAVEASCEQFLADRISNETCLGVWALADRMSCVGLCEWARDIALKYFEDVCKTEEFLEMPANFLKMYISDHGLHAVKEDRVLEVILLWARHNLEDRERHLEELMECVSFSNVDQNYLANMMETDEVFAGVSGIKELIKDQSRHAKPRQIQQQEIFFFIQNYMYRLDFHFNCVDTSDLPQSLQGSKGIAACVVNNDVIVTGGTESGSQALRYNSSLNSWTRLESLKRGRSCHGMVVLQGQAYVVGGFPEGGTETWLLSSCEVYNEMTNTWNMIAPLQQEVNSFGIAACCEKIYVFGGDFIWAYMDTLQCYDPVQNVWTLGKSLPKRVKAITACSINSKIYLVGGQLDCVLCYDHEDDNYTEVFEKLAPWDFSSAAVCGSEIIVTGGCRCFDEDEKEPTGTVQWYNVSSGNSWVWEDSLPVRIFGHKSVIVSKQ